MKANFYFLTLFFLLSIKSQAQFTCSGCPYFVDENNPATDQVTVSGLSLPTLGVNGQGVCEVRVNILSEGIGELGIILTSPSGDQVELMTETNFFTGTNYTYDISFVPCCEPAMPDPGFPDVFDANAGWQSNATYTGSYYPESFECLEDFTGDANGVWTIDFVDNVVIDDHDIIDWEIIFCEGTANSCFCDAEGGLTFFNYPTSACAGDPSLNLNPSVTYQNPPADPNLYGFEWIISDANTGEVLSIVANPDLTGLPSGSYSVCGFSFLLTDASLIPSPNGTLTLADYENDISSGAYCADIMTDCRTIDILDNLPDPILDWNITDLCLGQPYIFNVTNFDPSVNYQAFISSGSFSQFSFNNGQLVIAGLTGPINICVSIVEDCDMGQTCQVFNIISGGNPPVLSDPGDVCLGDNFNIAVLPPDNTSTYTWTITGPGTITQNNNDNIDVQVNGVGVIDICVEDTNTSCGTPTPVCTQINVVDVPAPDIFPDPFYCIPDGFIVGNANGSATSTVYSQVSGPGTITFNNPNVVSTAFTVDLAGTYVIELTKTLNGCTVSTTATIEVLPELDIISSVTCMDGQFTVEIIFNNGTGPYTVLGTTISGNVYTSPPYPSGSAVLTTYSDANGCEGDVFFQEFCPCVSDAGTMDVTPIEFCDLSGVATGIHNNDATLDSDDIGVYILHTSPNDVLGTVIDENNTGIFAFLDPPMISGVTYYISYVVGNDAGGSVDQSDVCLSVAPGVPVTWLAPVNVTVGIQSDVEPCDLFLTLEAINDAPVGSSIIHQWTVINAPAGGGVTFSAVNNSVTDATFSIPGVYEIQYQGSLNNCLFDDSIILTVEEAFTIDAPLINCAPDGSTYTVSFSISGGTDPILIDGLTYNGVSFESAPIINGDAYSFTITDASSCPAQFVSGNFTCPCSTGAGTMDQTVLELCGSNALAQGIYNNDGTLDGNDVAYFVLHDGALNSLGNIFDINTTGAFNFLAGMNFGQTYYISYVVGNPDGSFIDVNDPCLSVAFGQAVIWNDFPSVSLPANFETCDLVNTLTANVTAGASIEWSIADAPPGSNPFFSSTTSLTTNLDVDVEGVYIINITASQNNCDTQESIEIEVYPQISIGNLTEICEGSTYRVSFDIFGGEGDFDVNGVVLSGNNFLSEPINSGDPYTFTISDFNNCQLTGIQGVRNCDCLTDAGTMPGNLLEACGEEVLEVGSSIGFVLDADDIGLFYLHDNNSTVLGNILAVNDNGVFARPAGVVAGQTYYVSFVVGNPSNGEVDLNDPCLDVSFGQPVVWYDPPLNELPDTLSFCQDTLIGRKSIGASSPRTIKSEFAASI
jgi:predicted RNA-binding protein with TRAM domain